MLSVATGHRSHVGRVRAHNEDALFVGDHVWAVADGMGGHAAGDVASGLVIEGLRTLDAAAPLRPADVVAALEATNDRILRHGHENPSTRGLGSTVAGIARLQVGGTPHAAVFNVGDSRVYRVSGATLTRATVDHSEAEELVAGGVITREQALTHRSRHVVTRSLGQPDTPRVDLWLVPFTSGDRFLVCSDGLTTEVDDDTIRDIMVATPDPSSAAASLVEAALVAGGRDNVSVIVVDVAGETPVEGSTRPRPKEAAV